MGENWVQLGSEPKAGVFRARRQTGARKGWGDEARKKSIESRKAHMKGGAQVDFKHPDVKQMKDEFAMGHAQRRGIFTPEPRDYRKAHKDVLIAHGVPVKKSKPFVEGGKPTWFNPKTTVKTPSASNPGAFHWTDTKQGKCSCPAKRFKGNCSHLLNAKEQGY